MARIKLAYVCSNVDRHGNVRYYFNRRGAPNRIRLPGLPGSADFMSVYAAVLGGKPLPQIGPPKETPKELKRGPDGSLEWLCNRYYNSTFFKGFAENTVKNKRSILDLLCAETLGADGTGPRVGSMPFEQMTAKHIRVLRDRKSDTPSTADAYVKQLSALFKWAIENELATTNPARDVPRKRPKGKGFHTWTVDEVRQYENTHPIGTQARLALALHIYTGQRKSDGIRLGPGHRTAGERFVFTQKKNETRDPIDMNIPVLPELAKIIAATECGTDTYLINDLGDAWTIAGFGNRFRDWCDQAGLHHCTVHGLRKAAASLAAENGATTPHLMAIFGWRDSKQAEIYTRAARRAKMTGESMHLIVDRETANL